MPPKRGRHRHGRGGRGPGPQRIQGFVEPTLLLLLHMGPMHGYGLLERMGELDLADYPVDSSMIYRTLRSLENSGMVASAWDVEETAGPPRRVYRLTEEGDAYLGEWIADLRATKQALQRFLDAYDRHMEHGQGPHHE